MIGRAKIVGDEEYYESPFKPKQFQKKNHVKQEDTHENKENNGVSQKTFLNR